MINLPRLLDSKAVGYSADSPGDNITVQQNRFINPATPSSLNCISANPPLKNNNTRKKHANEQLTHRKACK